MYNKHGVIRFLVISFILSFIFGFCEKDVHAQEYLNNSPIDIKESKKQNEVLKPIENNLLKDVSVEFDRFQVYETTYSKILVKGNLNKSVNYRVLLHSLKDNQWIDLTSGYTLNRKGNELYQAFIPKLELGNYEAIVFCKEANSMGNKTVRLGQYDDYIVKKFEYLKNGDPIVQVNLIGGRGSSFGQEHGYICYNYIRINNNYLFHSVLHHLDGSIIQAEYKKLGKKASHGCINLKMMI